MNSITSISSLIKNNSIITNLIRNHNFISPSISSNSFQYIKSSLIVDGWNLDRALLLNNSAAWGFPMPYPNGNQCVCLQGANTLSQNVSLTSGVNYTLLFKACGRPSTSSNIITIELLKNNNLFSTIVSNLTTPTSWKIYMYNFTVNESNIFTFRIRGTIILDRSTAFQNIILRQS